MTGLPANTSPALLQTSRGPGWVYSWEPSSPAAPVHSWGNSSLQHLQQEQWQIWSWTVTMEWPGAAEAVGSRASDCRHIYQGEGANCNMVLN